MAQVYFTHENKEVLTGYDRTLDYSFLTIRDVDGEVEYSTLDEATAFLMCAEDIIEKLDNLNIPYPPDLGERLKRLERFQVGNDRYQYPSK